MPLEGSGECMRKFGNVFTRVMPLLLTSGRCSPGAEEEKGHTCKDNEACVHGLWGNSGQVRWLELCGSCGIR